MTDYAIRAENVSPSFSASVLRSKAGLKERPVQRRGKRPEALDLWHCATPPSRWSAAMPCRGIIGQRVG